MARRDDKVPLLEAVAREVAERADMPVPDLCVCKMKGRVAAYTSIFHGNRIIVNELVLYVLNKTE